MADRFKDKEAIITGGSKGIGEGCVRVFREYIANDVGFEHCIDLIFNTNFKMNDMQCRTMNTFAC